MFHLLLCFAILTLATVPTGSLQQVYSSSCPAHLASTWTHSGQQPKQAVTDEQLYSCRRITCGEIPLRRVTAGEEHAKAECLMQRRGASETRMFYMKI